MIPLDHIDDDPPPTRGQAIAAGVALLVSLGLVVAFFVFAIDRAFSATPAPTYAPTSVLPPPEPPIEITAPASASATALRVSPPTTEPERIATFDCGAAVNAISYEWMNLEPARAAYRITAGCMGWPADITHAWEAFIVDDVIRHESGGCPNLRGGARVIIWRNCIVDPQGTREDSGFGQLIGVWWRGPGTPVCDRLALCTSNDVIVSAWNSMRALLVAVEHDGSRPWCYDAAARRLHDACAWTPRRWPT